MLRTLKVNEQVFYQIETLRLAISKRTKRSVSKGELIEAMVSKYIRENEIEQKGDAETHGEA